jgi:adenylate kinase
MQTEKPLLIILLGAPGSGKGTLATKLVEEFKVTHISTGDMFRYNIKEQTPIGKEAKGYLDRGQLVPDETVIKMVKERLGKPDCAQGILFDGFPRTIAQAQALEPLIAAYNPIVLSINISDDIVVQRLAGRRYCPKCGATYHISFAPPKAPGTCDTCKEKLCIRSDDVESTVRQRLAVFHKEIGPLLDFYNSKKLVVEVDGSQGAQQVAQDAIARLHQFKDTSK